MWLKRRAEPRFSITEDTCETRGSIPTSQLWPVPPRWADKPCRSDNHSQPLVSFHPKNKNLGGMHPLCSPEWCGDGRRGWCRAGQEGLSSAANPAIGFFLAQTVKPRCQSMRLFPFKVGGRGNNPPSFKAELSAAHAAAQRPDSPNLPVKATLTHHSHSQTSLCN